MVEGFEFQPDSESMEPNQGSHEELSQLPETGESRELSPEQKYEAALDFVVENVWRVKDLHKEIRDKKEQLDWISHWQAPAYIPDQADRSKWQAPSPKEERVALANEIKQAKQEIRGRQAIGHENLQDLLVQGEVLGEFKAEDIKHFIQETAKWEDMIRGGRQTVRGTGEYRVDTEKFPKDSPGYEIAQRLVAEANVPAHNAWKGLERSRQEYAKMLSNARDLGVPHELILERAAYEADNKDHPGLYRIMREWL